MQNCNLAKYLNLLLEVLEVNNVMPSTAEPEAKADHHGRSSTGKQPTPGATKTLDDYIKKELLSRVES